MTMVATVVYGPLALVAFAWAWWGGNRLPWSLDRPWLAWSYAPRLALSVGAGFVLALIVIALTPQLVARTRWARELHLEFRRILAPLNAGQITVLALLSGFAEELFFRGALQPVVGLWFASLIFGGVHVGPRRILFPWALWAFVMGLLFGLLFELTGVLWGPILAHFLINQRNMIYIRRHAPITSQGPGALSSGEELSRGFRRY